MTTLLALLVLSSVTPSPQSDPQFEPLPEDAVVCLGSRQWLHAGDVESVALSPDGRFALSGSNDRTMVLWDVTTGNRVRTFDGHRSGVSAVAFTSDGKRVVSAGWTQIIVWDIATGKRLKVLECTEDNDQIEAMILSPDSRRMLWGTLRGTLALTDLDTGARVLDFKDSADRVSCLAFSGDGMLAVSGTCNNRQPSDNLIHLWDVVTGKRLRSFSGHRWEVTRTLFTADNKSVLSSSRDYSVRLWSVKTGEMVKSLVSDEGSGSGARGLALSPDETRFLCCDNHGNLHLRDFKSGERIETINAGCVIDVVFSRDGRFALTGRSRNPMGLWNLETRALVHQPVTHASPVSAGCFSPDGTRVLTASDDRQLALWDATTGACVRRLTGHSERVESAVLSQDGRIAVSSSIDSKILVWDTSSGRMLQTLKGRGEPFWSVDLSRDGKRILSGSGNGLSLWDLDSGRRVQDHAAQDQMRGILAVAFSPDGRLALSGGVDELTVWDLASEAPLRTIKAPDNWFISVAFSEDGRRALAGTKDRLIYLFDPRTGVVIRKMREDADWVQIAISPDGGWAASGSYDGTLNLWDLETGKRIRAVTGHLGRIRSVRFSPGGRKLITASEDCTALIWQPLLEETRRAAEWTRGWKALDPSKRKEELSRLCADLAAEELEPSTAARERLMTLGKEGVDAVLAAWPPESKPALTPEQAGKLRQLLARLDANDGAEREKAQKELEASGAGALEWIDDRLRDPASLTPELKSRLESARLHLRQAPLDAGDLGRVRAVLMLREELSVDGVPGALTAYSAGPDRSLATMLARRTLQAK